MTLYDISISLTIPACRSDYCVLLTTSTTSRQFCLPYWTNRVQNTQTLRLPALLDKLCQEYRDDQTARLVGQNLSRIPRRSDCPPYWTKCVQDTETIRLPALLDEVCPGYRDGQIVRLIGQIVSRIPRRSDCPPYWTKCVQDTETLRLPALFSLKLFSNNTFQLTPFVKH